MHTLWPFGRVYMGKLHCLWRRSRRAPAWGRERGRATCQAAGPRDPARARSSRPLFRAGRATLERRAAAAGVPGAPHRTGAWADCLHRPPAERARATGRPIGRRPSHLCPAGVARACGRDATSATIAESCGRDSRARRALRPAAVLEPSRRPTAPLTASATKQQISGS